MLNENSTPLESCQFFQNCKQELRAIVQQSNLHKKLRAHQTKLTRLHQSQKTEELDRLLLNNIVIDFLRSYKLDYSYSVFMKECNMVSAEIASKQQLAKLLGVDKEYAQCERFNVSLIELLANVVQSLRKQRRKLEQTGIQVNTLQKTGQTNNVMLMENKFQEIRQQVEEREKKYYQKMVESMKVKQILGLREEISKQYEQKLARQKNKLSKKYQQTIQKMKSNDPKKLKDEVEALLTKNHELQTTNLKLSEQNKQLTKEKISHNCKQTKDWKQMESRSRQERKQLQVKKRQLDLALRNISTKVEDLVNQKKKIQSQSKAETFMQEVRTHKQNKDHMIEIIHAQMRQMDRRIQILAEENQRFRDQARQTKQKMKQGAQIISKPGQQESSIPKPCSRCQLSQKFKTKTKNVLIGVSENDFNQQTVQKDESSSESDDGETQTHALEQKQKIARLQSDMRLIKNKVRLLVEQF